MHSRLVVTSFIVIMVVNGNLATPFDIADLSIKNKTGVWSAALNSEPAVVTLTQVVFRNGDRNPLVTWPNDENNDDVNDLGQMTMKGKRQCFALGQWMQLRYENTSILQSGYSASSVYIRSVDTDRCLQCASSLAAGMFPPKTENDSINRNLEWQPVSIHSVSEDSDRLLGETINCSAYHRAYAQLMQTALFRQLHMKSKYLFGEMSKHTGAKITKPAEALNVRDALQIHEKNNKTLTEWEKSIIQSTELDQMYHLMLRSFTYNQALTRLRTGFMLKEILDRTSGKPSQTAYLYSAHGSTITHLMNTLHIYNHQPVPYSASLIFEKLIINSEPHLRILYLYDISAEPLELSIPGCDPHPCPVRRLYEIFADVLPDKSFEAECAVADKDDMKRSASFGAKLKRTWNKLFG